ncbi:hypothetical protein KBY97_03500 [Synechococcus sp. ATX 2A4]|uniref:hypothetical protein n=1 Tax=Synechococcus sp. ATX 2A4 TaxID=2823727 RepID=UPI0020CDCE8B|nr:hypothetical protein [Synechococcus sp. ATX 2A4]MCP9884195.1 hypothetical protein [Synechococcus sp. ATX 2A4]
MDAAAAAALSSPEQAGSAAQQFSALGSTPLLGSGTPSTHSPLGSVEVFRDALGILRPGTPAGFSKADLLGGPLTLASSGEAAMPVLARAERARWASSGDQLAPLPAHWRQPMRQAVQQLVSPGHETPAELSARVIHIPSSRLRAMEQVPVAIRDDGTATVLRAPIDNAALQEIEGWAARQPLPKQGVVDTALLTLHPMPHEPGPSPTHPAHAVPLPLASTPAPAPGPSAPAPRSAGGSAGLPARLDNPSPPSDHQAGPLQ